MFRTGAILAQFKVFTSIQSGVKRLVFRALTY